jgi:hypothetical protein
MLRWATKDGRWYRFVLGWPWDDLVDEAGTEAAMRQISPRISVLRSIGLALAALLAAGAAAGFARAATEGRPVQTETIIVQPDNAMEPGMPAVPPDSAMPDSEAAPDGAEASPDKPEPAALPDAPLPEIEYDVSKLPAPVARLRQQIIDAAATGELEKLKPVIEANGEPPQLSVDEIGDPIAFLRSSSGDDGGREILAILTEVLEAGYVHVGVGTKDDVYVWPYFAYYPVDKLTPPQLVELFKLVYAGDYEDMKAYGTYFYYRVGISPDGTWKFFLAGD